MRLFFIFLLLINQATSSVEVARVSLNPPIEDSLIAAIIYVESRGDSMAYNKREDAVGVLQIRPIMVREVNRLLGYNKYKLSDRWNIAKSKEMFNIVKANISNPTNERVARVWNGGYNGNNKRATLPYWYKVKNQINKI